MNIQQRFHVKQHDHEIWFFAYDIEKVSKITPYDLSKIYVPECSDRDTLKGCDQRNIRELCCQCRTSHLQELLMDGWRVGNKRGFLDEDSYYALLQTGIRVPVNKEIYEAWKSGWTTEPYCVNSNIYEISRKDI